MLVNSVINVVTRSAKHFTDVCNALHCQRRSGVIDQDQISAEWQPVTTSILHNWSQQWHATVTRTTERYRDRETDRQTGRWKLYGSWHGRHCNCMVDHMVDHTPEQLRSEQVGQWVIGQCTLTHDPPPLFHQPTLVHSMHATFNVSAYNMLFPETVEAQSIVLEAYRANWYSELCKSRFLRVRCCAAYYILCTKHWILHALYTHVEKLMCQLSTSPLWVWSFIGENSPTKF